MLNKPLAISIVIAIRQARFLQASFAQPKKLVYKPCSKELLIMLKAVILEILLSMAPCTDCYTILYYTIL